MILRTKKSTPECATLRLNRTQFLVRELHVLSTNSMVFSINQVNRKQLIAVPYFSGALLKHSFKGKGDKRYIQKICYKTTYATGLMPRSNLSWSPDSSYLFSGSIDGSFDIWETTNWSHESWASPNQSRIVSVKWMPDSKAVLIAFSNGGLFSLMFIGEAPSLHAQVLPVSLPELDLTPTDEGMPSSSLAKIFDDIYNSWFL